MARRESCHVELVSTFKVRDIVSEALTDHSCLPAHSLYLATARTRL